MFKHPHGSESESAHLLASARLNGVRVSAFVVRFQRFHVPPITRARPAFKVFAHPRLWKEVDSISDATMDMPLPDEETPLREVVRSAYDTMASLELVPRSSHSDELFLEDKLDDRTYVRQIGSGGVRFETYGKGKPFPSEVDFETFFEHIEATPQFGNVKTSTTTIKGEGE